MMNLESFFSPCPRGLETLLTAELQQMGANDIVAVDGGVGFSGAFTLSYRVNLESRIASRVLWRVGSGNYANEQDVYRAVCRLSWADWFSPDLSIRVAVTATRSPLKSLDFITLKIKDAVCDSFRNKTQRRPNVAKHEPDVRIHGYFDATSFAIYVDTSGDPLFKRGYRVASGEAAIRENLAAGLLRLAQWSPGIALLDPMCGSGTILIEAALIALEIAPGLARQFAFEKLSNFDSPQWDHLREQCAHRKKATTVLNIYGSDLYGDSLKEARTNLQHAGLEQVVSLKQANILEISAPEEKGIIVTNPPYGVRIGDQDALVKFYPALGDALKNKFAGWDAYIFSGDLRLPKLIGLAPSRKTPLFNGGLECRLYKFPIVQGSMRKKAAECGDLLPGKTLEPKREQSS